MDLVDWDPEVEPPEPPKQTKVMSLFRFFNKASELLYVSQKPNFAILMKADWWRDTDHIDVEHFDSLDAVADAKAKAIYNEDPKWNTQGRRTDV